MFWIALEPNNPKMGLTSTLSELVSKLTASKNVRVAKFGITDH